MSATERLLDRARAELGLTSDYQLAAAVGWNKGVVSNYRKNKRQMDVQMCEEFAEKTGIPLKDVVRASVSDKNAKRAQISINFSAAA